MTWVSAEMPELSSRSFHCSGVAMSRRMPSESWVSQFQPTAPGMCPESYEDGVDVHLDQANVVVVAVGGDPIGVDEDIWIHIFGH